MVTFRSDVISWGAVKISQTKLGSKRPENDGEALERVGNDGGGGAGGKTRSALDAPARATQQ